MTATEDTYYIQNVIGGDTSAYAHLVDKYSSMVYSIALKLLKNKADAEDLAQEAFVAAFEALGSFKGNAKFSTWLYRIAFNLSISKTRKGKRETYTENERTLERLSDGEENTSDGDEAEERELMVQNAIRGLPDDEQLLILLYYYEEQTIDDISHIMGLSVSNVKVKLHRTRKKLRDAVCEKQAG